MTRQSEFYFEITRQGMKLCILQAPYPRPTVISTRTVKHQLGLEKKETSRIQATLFENFFKDTWAPNKVKVTADNLVSGEFTKPRRRRQRERHWTEELISTTMALHVRYNSWYISLLSSVKQQHVMTKFCIVWRTFTTTANFLNLYFKLTAVFRI